MKKFTLDTNCMLEVADNREQRTSVLTLIKAHEAGEADVALVASSGSEKLQDGSFSVDFADFERRRNELGLGNLSLLFPIARYDISFFDKALNCDQKMIDLEEEIFSILFPTTNVSWPEEAEKFEVSVEDRASKYYEKWRNKLLDAQMFWTHVWNDRDAFVTKDGNFARKLGVSRFSEHLVLTPREAVGLLENA